MYQPPQEQPPTWYPPNQGRGSPQYRTSGQQPPYPQPRPQQPYFYPPPYSQQRPPPPPKKKHTGWIIAAVIAGLLVICGAIGSVANPAGSSSTTVATNDVQPTDTPVPTDTPIPTTWTTVQTFSGNGEKKTSVFTVPDHWRLKWKCNPSSDYFGTYNVIIDVDAPDGTQVDGGAINTICQTGNTSGSTEEYQGGDVFLDAQIGGAWAIEVQELQ